MNESVEKQKQLQEQQVLQTDQLQLNQLQQQVPAETAIQLSPQTQQVQLQANAQQTVQMQQQARRVEVDFGPPDDALPVPTEMPKRSWKQQRRHNKALKQASENLKEGFAAHQKYDLDDVKAANRQSGKDKYDLRSVALFCDSFHLDKYGNPKTPEDKAILERGSQRMRDYVLGDQTTHDKVLGEMTKEFLSIKVDIKCFDDPEETLKNYTELHKLGNRIRYFNNVIHDNPAYFAALDQETRNAITKQLDRFENGGFCSTLTNVARMYGMQGDNGKIEDAGDPTTRMLYQTAKNDYKNSCIKEKVNPMLDEFSANIRKDFELMRKPGGEGLQAARRHYTNKAVRSQFPLAESRWESVKSGGGEQPEAEKAYNAFKNAQNDYNEMLIQRDALMAAEDALTQEKDDNGRLDPLAQESLEVINRQIKALEPQIVRSRERAVSLASESITTCDLTLQKKG